MFNLSFNRNVFFILVVLSTNLFADECEGLKYQILEQKNTSSENLEKLNKGIQTEKHAIIFIHKYSKTEKMIYVNI